ncbi:MAG: thioredoxin family protein [Janthinobacterium lividum]
MSASSASAPLPAPAYTYAEFRALVSTLAAEHRTTGPEQGPALVRFTEQNQQHLDRAYALPLLPELVDRLRHLDAPQRWLVLAEAWCGDTAHELPLLAHLAEGSGGRVALHVLLRSEHPDFMAAHQTNGKDSIPKLVVQDAATGQTVAEWGPRPAPAQELAHRLHSDPAQHTAAIVRQMNEWYTTDQGQALQRELLAVLA